MRQLWILTAIVAAMLIPAPVQSQVLDPLQSPFSIRPDTNEKYSIRTIVSHKTVKPGDRLYVAVEMTIAEDAWLYGPVAGGKIVEAVSLEVKVNTSSLTVGKVLFPPTKHHATQYAPGKSDTYNVYEGKVYLFIPVTVPVDSETGNVQLNINIRGQICDKDGLCTQVAEDITAGIEIGPVTVASPGWTDRIDEILSQSKSAGQWSADLADGPAITTDWGDPSGAGVKALTTFALALLAGLILNIMPCVLPVIPLRLLALLEQAGQSHRRFITLGLAFAGGIVLFFVALATANVILKLSMQYTIKQADLFRHTGPVIAMILLLVALAANMFGVFTVTVPGRVASAQPKRGHLGAVGMGFLMAVLSTPCSFAIIATVFTSAVLFLSLTAGTVAIILIGVGMAAPHALLAFAPKIVARLPRAGKWTELFKQSVGFVFLLIAVWLLRTQMDKAYPAWVAGYGVVLAMCLWMYGSWVRFDSAWWKKWSVRIAAAAIAVSAGWWMLTPPEPLAVKMRPYDAAEIALARQEGKIVLIKFTATTCPECKVLDMTVYNDHELAEALQARGVLVFKGDVTRKDMPAGKMLFEKLREPGPPLTVIFLPGNPKPIRLRKGLSGKLIIRKIDEAKEKK